MRRLLLFIFLIPCFAHAQPQNANWTFSNFNGLKFLENEQIEYFESQAGTGELGTYERECAATISDSSGNLLFYFYVYGVRAGKIMDANHHLIANGDSILANYSATNGAVIVPKPNNPYLYCLYTLGGGYGGVLKIISSKR